MSQIFNVLKKHRRLDLTLVVGIACVLSVSLALFRVYYTGKLTFLFLNWNLFLALLPWGISSVLQMNQNNLNSIFKWIGISLWLLFFPNAPYMLTDLFHLHQRNDIPLWFDLPLIVSFAFTGLMLGFISLMDIQDIITKMYGKTTGWVFSFSSLMLGSFGVYLGRYLRFNSWDLITTPTVLLHEIADTILHPFTDPKVYAITILYSLLLIVGYLLLQQMRSMNFQENES
ncbi:DUF1361 domain-containing protein [soil metagenome]